MDWGSVWNVSFIYQKGLNFRKQQPFLCFIDNQELDQEIIKTTTYNRWRKWLGGEPKIEGENENTNIDKVANPFAKGNVSNFHLTSAHYYLIELSTAKRRPDAKM